VKLSRGLTTHLGDAEKRIERLAERDGEEPTTQPMEIAGDDDNAPGELPF